MSRHTSWSALRSRSFWKQVSSRWSHPARISSYGGRYRQSLTAEPLEDRALLSVVPLITNTTQARVVVPSPTAFEDVGLDWTGGNEPFDDTAWLQTPAGGANGVGYNGGTSIAYTPFFDLDLRTLMAAAPASATAFIRLKFSAPNISQLSRLTLAMRYDDGFVAWINGVEVTRAGVTGYPARDATVANNPNSAASNIATFDISSHLDALREGTNVLAIRGVNSLRGDSPLSANDFLMQAALEGVKNDVPPTAVNDVVNAIEGTTTVIPVLANDVKGTGNIVPSSVLVAQPPAHGTAIVNPNGTIAYTPTAGYTGADSFTYTVRDDTVSSSVVPVTLSANTSNLRYLIPSSAAIDETWRDRTFLDTSWTVAAGPIGYDTSGSFTSAVGLPDDNAPGGLLSEMYFASLPSAYIRKHFNVADPATIQSLTLRIRSDDGFIAYINGVQIASFNAPAAPAYNSVATASAVNANAVTFVDYPIMGAALTAALGALVSGVNVLAIHGVNVSANSADFLQQAELVGTAFASLQSNPATVSLTIRGLGPIAVDDAATTTGTQSVTIPVLANDVQGLPPSNNYPLNPETVNVTQQPARGTVVVDPATGSISYTANPGTFGEDTFFYTVRDTNPDVGGTISQTPLAVNATWKYLDDGSNQMTAWKETNFNDSAWKSGSGPFGYGAPGAAFTTTLRCDPNPGDGCNEATNDNYASYYLRTSFQLEDPSVVQSLKVLMQYDDGAFVYINGVEVARAGVFAGAEAYDIHVTASNVPSLTEVANLTREQSSTLLHPGANVVAVLLKQGGNNSSDILMGMRIDATLNPLPGRVSNPAAVRVTVLPTSDPPVAHDDHVTALANQPIEIDVLANDVPGGTPIDPATVTVVDAPAHGTYQVLSNGRIAYAPNANFIGADQFTYTVRDTIAGRMSNVATVSIDVAANVVTAHGDSYSVDEDDVLLIGAPYGVLANDQSANGAALSASVVEAPQHGTLTVSANGAFQYTPNHNFFGDDQFHYRAADTQGVFAEATATIHVIGGPDAPIAFGDLFSTIAGTPLRIDANATQPHDLVSAGSVWRYLDNGSNQGSAWRQIAYDDNAWQSGPAQLGYGDGDEATVVGFGGNVNQRYATTYFRRDFNYSPSGPVRKLILDLLRDDGAVVYLNGARVVTSNIATNATYNTFADSAVTGSDENTFMAYELDPSQLTSGKNVIAVEVHQSSAASADLSFDLRLRAIVAAAATGGALANDVDPDGDLLTAELVSGPAHGALVFDPDGGFLYTPAASFVGVDSFTYRASDGSRFSNVATVTINVTPPPSAPAADLNGDEVVDRADLAMLIHYFGAANDAARGVASAALPGDLNGDGCVDVGDALVWRQAADEPAAASGALIARATPTVRARASRVATAAERSQPERVVAGDSATHLRTARRAAALSAQSKTTPTRPASLAATAVDRWFSRRDASRTI